MFYYLYEIRNNLNNKIYLGVHKTENINDGYMGSGKVIQDAIKKYGIDNFTKTIIEEFNTSEEMYNREKEVVNEEFLLREDVYNLRRGGFGGFDYINNLGIDKFKGKKHTDETKTHLRKVLLGRKHSDETRQKISDNNWSKKDPYAQKRHASMISQKREKSEEEKEKIALSISNRHKDGVYNYTHLIGNSYNKNKRWVNNGNEQRMISKDLPLPEGWFEGRK
jgi:group I intron endonuclease